MLVFVDEAGDTGLKIEQGSSPFFIITLVILEDHEEAEALDMRINLLRRELGFPTDFEFHFTQNSERVREAFFKAVVPYNFFYFSVIINKAELYGPGFKFKGSFYKYTSSLVFENAKPHLDDAIVIFDGSGSREFKKQFATYLKKKINETKGKRCYVRKVKMQDSGKNNLIQLADMVCGAIANSLKKGKKRKNHRQIIRHREVYVQFWPKKKSSEP